MSEDKTRAIIDFTDEEEMDNVKDEEADIEVTIIPRQHSKSVVDSLERSMINFDSTVEYTSSIRDQMLAKLMKSFNDLQLETNSMADPDLMSAQSRLLEQIRGLLNDMDASTKNHVNIKLKKTDIDNQHQSNINAAELLAQLKLTNDNFTRQVTMHTITPSDSEIEARLAERIENATDMPDIPDTELEVGGSKLPAHNKDPLD